MINSDPPRRVIFTNFNNMKKDFDLAVGEIQSTFNMFDAIMKKGNKSSSDEKLIAGTLSAVTSAGTFLNKLALGTIAGPITVAAASVTTAVGGLLLLSAGIRRKILDKKPEWVELMGSNIEIIYGTQTKEVNLKDFCINPEDTFKQAFGIDDLSDAAIKAFNKANKEIPQASVEKILKAGEIAKDIDTKVKLGLAISGFVLGAYAGKTTFVPISLGYPPDWAKNLPENRQQIIKPNVEDLTAVPRRRLKPRN